MKKTTLTFILVISLFIAILGYMSYAGSLLATIALVIIGTATLLLFGAGIALIGVKLMNDQAQRQFQDNAQENLAIMNQLQSIQNKQNSTLMQQLGQVSRLPDNGSKAQFLIEDGIFEDLDN